MCMEQRAACRASDSRSTGCGSTAKRGRFALFSCLTQQAGVFSTGTGYPSLIRVQMEIKWERLQNLFDVLTLH